MLDQISRNCESEIYSFLEAEDLCRVSVTCKAVKETIRDYLQTSLRLDSLNLAFFQSKQFPNGRFTSNVPNQTVYQFITDPERWDQLENTDYMPQQLLKSVIDCSSERVTRAFHKNSQILTNHGNVYSLAKPSTHQFPQSILLVAENVVGISEQDAAASVASNIVLASGAVLRSRMLFKFPEFPATPGLTSGYNPVGVHIKGVAEHYTRKALVTRENKIMWRKSDQMRDFTVCDYFAEKGLCVVKVEIFGSKSMIILAQGGRVFRAETETGKIDNVSEIKLKDPAVDVFKQYCPRNFFNQVSIVSRATHSRKDFITIISSGK